MDFYLFIIGGLKGPRRVSEKDPPWAKKVLQIWCFGWWSQRGKRQLILLQSLFQTAVTLGKWFAPPYIDNLSERTEEMFAVRAEELGRILGELGLAYIKIAQAISSRNTVMDLEKYSKDR
ncbi:hypothetical protein M9H77_32304 [Catharanthus roseus]|uniref:Uncharacterized protein n=1 Tax=Catharanthus roseus TaxID=4058 RepID=A0ACC0A3T0_CATRO|nr:hypothetical protein M9H77_32304 [Catharanthus roseus]